MSSFLKHQHYEPERLDWPLPAPPQRLEALADFWRNFFQRIVLGLPAIRTPDNNALRYPLARQVIQVTWNPGADMRWQFLKRLGAMPHTLFILIGDMPRKLPANL